MSKPINTITAIRLNDKGSGRSKVGRGVARQGGSTKQGVTLETGKTRSSAQGVVT